MSGQYHRIGQAFAQARAAGHAALIPYVTAGFPSLEALPEIVASLRDAGADLIEVGIPFSDPLADGPILQQISTEALARGTKIVSIFETLTTITPTAPPILILTYVNPIMRRGVPVFAQLCADAGVAGVIIPDLPWVEGEDIRREFLARSVAPIPLVAPTSTASHFKALKSARGFVYGVSVTGVTGMRQTVASGVEHLIEETRLAVRLPIAIGFGISTPEQAQAVGRMADGVIVGSALMARLKDHPERAAWEAGELVRRFRHALDS